jgi:Universal stress protein family
VHRTVLVGRPGAELASLGRLDDDLLVVGTRGGRQWRHPGRRSVSRYCATHSRCPTLVVPRAELARTMYHGFVPRDLWKEFDSTSHGTPWHVG